MATMKLGELLVREGKITPEGLEEVLKEQAIFGGRFGTNLVEMGYLNEQELAHFLSKKSGIPNATHEQLMNIPPQMTRLLSEELVRKYKVVPVALNNRKLTLAMADPTDFSSIDEISFMTGYIVIPLITPELRLVRAMEQYYNIKPELRYLHVAGGGRNRRGSAHSTPPSPVLKSVPVKTLGSEPDDCKTFEIPPLAEPYSICTPDDDPKGGEPACAPAGGYVGEKKDFTLDAVLRGLAQGGGRNSIAELLVGYASERFNRAALLLVKGESATGWMARSGGRMLPGFDALEIRFDEPSLLRTVAQSGSHYLGPMPASNCDALLMSSLGVESGMNQLLMPISMMGRVVAVLYLDGESLRMDDKVPELQKLIGKVCMAFEILILKSKILLT